MIRRLATVVAGDLPYPIGKNGQITRRLLLFFGGLLHLLY
jgi:hypothetical protein